MAQASTSATIDHIPVVRLASPRDLEEYRKSVVASSDPNAPRVIVCCGTGCQATGSVEVIEALRTAVAEAGWDGKVIPRVKQTGCHGFCSRGPLVIVEPESLFYQRVTPADVPEIVTETLLGGRPVKRLLYKSAESKEFIPHTREIPFYAKQTRIV